MKKFLFTMVCAMTTICAFAQDGKLTINAGFLFPSTLNATIGYEHPLSYGNAVEVFAEMGDHWQTPVCHRFWKGYYWMVVGYISTVWYGIRTGCSASVLVPSSGRHSVSSFLG